MEAKAEGYVVQSHYRYYKDDEYELSGERVFDSLDEANNEISNIINLYQ